MARMLDYVVHSPVGTSPPPAGRSHHRGRSFWAPASKMPLAAHFSSPRGLHFAWLCIARDFRRCDYVYPWWAGTSICVTSVQLILPLARHTGFYHRVGAL